MGKGLVWLVTSFFVLNVLALIAAVVVNSFSTRWLGTWLPAGFTGRWYGSAWTEFQLDGVLNRYSRSGAGSRGHFSPGRRAGGLHHGSPGFSR
jgi:hypothetical protein